MAATSPFFDYPAGADDPGKALPVEPAFLSELREEDLQTLLRYVEVRRLRPEETLIEAGSDDPSLFIVTIGSLEVRRPRRRRDEVLTRLPVGSVVGELAFFDGKPRSARVVASEHSEVLRMGRSSFESLAAANPNLGRLILMDLGRVLSGRFRSLQDVRQ